MRLIRFLLWSAMAVAAPLGSQPAAEEVRPSNPTESKPLAPPPGPPEEASPPASPTPIFDKIRWTMTLDQIKEAYTGTTFWYPPQVPGDLFQCLKWQDNLMDQAHLITVCADPSGYPVTVVIKSEDALSEDWIRILSERYGIAIPYKTRQFREEKLLNLPPYTTLLRIDYENFENRGRPTQNLSLHFTNTVRFEKIKVETAGKTNQDIRPGASGTPPPVPEKKTTDKKAQEKKAADKKK